ncbi:hypothetical protein K9M50_02765, partial [Patescibacteria group bacterium]|nr:hypothetical protein [Patescibacteria group bacterium]
DKEDKKNKEVNKDNKETEEKTKKEDDKKKKLEVNSSKGSEINDNIKEVSQENKNSISNNLSQAPVSSGKKSMQDIKVNNRIMGPIDELRYFNLKNFRRLSSEPTEAFAKIKDKIDLLAKESYEKKIEGIQAWRENPLNKLYHQISIESLNKSKPISEVLKQRQENDMDYLSSEELKALVAFNKSYMF